jgi:hypothetical protein
LTASFFMVFYPDNKQWVPFCKVTGWKKYINKSIWTKSLRSDSTASGTRKLSLSLVLSLRSLRSRNS